MLTLVTIASVVLLRLTVLSVFDTRHSLFWYKGNRTTLRGVMIYLPLSILRSVAAKSLEPVRLDPEEVNKTFSVDLATVQKALVEKALLFEVLATKHYPAVENYFVLIKSRSRHDTC